MPGDSEGKTGLGLSQVEKLGLAIVILIALLLRQQIHVRLFPDSIDYLTFARNILSGIHNTGDITLDSYRRPPLYPHLIALFSFGKGSPSFLIEVARQISVLSGAVLLLPLYLLGRKMFGVTAAAIAVLLGVITPEFLYFSGSVLTESLGTLFVVMSMLFLWQACDRSMDSGRRIQKNVWFLLLGVALGLAFLSRHALIGFLAISLVWFLLSSVHIDKGKFKNSRKMLQACLASSVILFGFLLVVLPQILYLHSETGKWALAVDSSSPARWLASSGENIRYSELYESVSKLAPDAEHYLLEVQENPGLFALILEQPGTYIKAYFSTLFRGYLPDTYPLPYPPVIIILVVIGVIGLAWQRKIAPMIFCLWAFGGYYLFMVLFLNLRDRYMFPAYPFLLLLAGFGASVVIKSATSRVALEEMKRRIQIGGGIFFSFLIGYLLLPDSIDLIKKQNAMADYRFYELLGGEISKRIEPSAVMFDRSPHLPFFSGGITAAPPYADIKDVIHFARKRGVRYWIITSSYVPQMRPQFAALLDPEKKHVGLEPVAIHRNDNSFLVIVYKILPEKKEMLIQ